jgi:FkbM family methyltransferase
MRGVYESGPVQVNAGDVVIDLGGHIGSFTRYAFTRGASAVVMFEPEPEHVRCVERCFAAEIATGRLHLIRAAAWKEKTVLHFQSNGVESRVSDAGGLEIPAVTIDEIVESLKLRRVDFIKADIEGAERVALEGARETISRFAPKMALCTYHLPDDPTVIPAVVQSIRPYDVVFNFGRSQAFFAAA